MGLKARELAVMNEMIGEGLRIFALGARHLAQAVLELVARGTRKGWTTWGDQAAIGYRPTWKTYANHSAAGRIIAAE